jgi:hypothetical protein
MYQILAKLAKKDSVFYAQEFIIVLKNKGVAGIR